LVFIDFFGGIIVCSFSGTLPGQTRAQAAAVAAAAGASVSGSVTAKTDILVVSAISGSKKITDAQVGLSQSKTAWLCGLHSLCPHVSEPQAKGVDVWDQAKWDQVTKSAKGAPAAKRKASALLPTVFYK